MVRDSGALCPGHSGETALRLEKVGGERPNRSVTGEERSRAEISDVPLPFIIPGRCQ